MPTCSKSSMVRARRARRPSFSWIFRASIIWNPIVKHGFKLVIGSWKIIAMSLPLMRRRARLDSVSRSLPWNVMWSAWTTPG